MATTEERLDALEENLKQIGDALRDLEPHRNRSVRETLTALKRIFHPDAVEPVVAATPAAGLVVDDGPEAEASKPKGRAAKADAE